MVKKQKGGVIMFMGPPGSGKGTQARLLQENFNFERIETGAILRAMRNENTPVAKFVTELVDAGKLAPPPLVAELVIGKTLEILERGGTVVFDGSPRTLFEAEELIKALKNAGVEKMIAFSLDISIEQARKRLLIRLVCTECNTPTTDDAEKCLKCGASLKKRRDDDPMAMETRWEEFAFRTYPCIKMLENLDILEHINADRTVEEVAESVAEIIKNEML